MIRSFRHTGLEELFTTGRSRRIGSQYCARILRLLDVLDAAVVPGDMNLPGVFFHPLHGRPLRYSVRVTANWRLTFGWDESDAVDVELEDYH